MKALSPKIFFTANVVLVLLAGCATTRPRPVDQTPTHTLANQVAELQNELQTKNQQIEQLQNQLEAQQHTLRPVNNFSKNLKVNTSSVIRVPNVTVKDLQQALVRVGLDPGPVDGRGGKKTKAAVKEFQRKHHVKADGIVGEKTWSLLKA